MKTKTLLISTALSTSILFTGCFGSFKLANSIYDWNMEQNSDVVKEVIFLGFLVIPVYGFAYFIDGLILNTIEYWTGGNPISMKEGEKDSKMVQFEGKTYTVTAKRHKFEILDENNEMTTLKYSKKENAWFIEKNGQFSRFPNEGLTAYLNKE